jgi:parvulin-like peptidyl-prolyl cis-trans isomerase-like protein
MKRSVCASVTILALGIALASLGGCAGTKADPTPPKPTPTEPAAAESSVISADILAREPLANTATVKHILISWNDLADNFQGHLDQRAAKRSKADAEAVVRSLVKQLQGGADFDTLMKANSEDTSSAMSARTFTVTPDAQLVIEFRQLSLRLKTGEFGVCQSDFGFHIIKRVS